MSETRRNSLSRLRERVGVRACRTTGHSPSPSHRCAAGPSLSRERERQA